MNINSETWIEHVLEVQNKEYGAYCLRKAAIRNDLLAISIATSIFISFFLLLWGYLTFELPQEEKHIISLLNSAQIKKENIETIKIEKKKDLNMIEVDILSINFRILADKELDRLFEEKLAEEAAQPYKISEEGIIKYSIDPKTGKRFNPKYNSEFPGGSKEFSKHLINQIKFNKLTGNENYHYENGDDEIDFEINTLVFIKFEINEQGKLENIELFKGSSDPKFNERILEAFKKSPNWIPAKNKGKYIRQTMIMPFHFNYMQPLIKYYSF